LEYSEVEIDPDFIKYGFDRGYYTLRIGKDKHFLLKIRKMGKPFSFRNSSNAHRIFFNNILDMNINKGLYFDNKTRFIIIEFPSDKHGYKEVKE